MPEERIQKVLAAAGVASRRAAEELVAAGRVRVDGRPATIGQKVDPLMATIEVDGTPVGIGAARAYVALHKPAGVTSTTRDRHAETTVLELIPTALAPDGTRLYPVGRLDQDSEGLLLLTNDGDWAERVLHPRFGVEREYAVALERQLTPDQVRTLNAGIRLDEGLARLAQPLRPRPGRRPASSPQTIDPRPDPALAWYRATLAQGWKRQLRRMFGAVDAPIARLVRVRLGPGLARRPPDRTCPPVEESRDSRPGRRHRSPARRGAVARAECRHGRSVVRPRSHAATPDSRHRET